MEERIIASSERGYSASPAQEHVSTNSEGSRDIAVSSQPPLPPVNAHYGLSTSRQYMEYQTEAYPPGMTNETYANPVKLFIGQVPRTMSETELLPVLEAFGQVFELTIIRDKLTGSHRGCAFASYASPQDAERAVEELHNKVTLPDSINPLQVRPAEGQAGAAQEHKLFIGMIPKTATEQAIYEIFGDFGPIDEVFILRHQPTGQSKGCAFLKFKERESAVAAIEQLNGKITMMNGVSPLVVKFADSRRQRLQRVRSTTSDTSQAGYWQMPHIPDGSINGISLPVSQMQQMQQHYMQQVQAFGTQANGIGSGSVLPGSTSPTNSFMYYNPYALSGAMPYGYNGSMYETMGAPNPAYSESIGHSGSSDVMTGADAAALTSSLAGIDINANAGGTRSTTQLEGPPGANLFIYHLPHDLTDADLATAFAPFGTVISAKVYMDKLTGESKGFGFVSYDASEAADNAIASMNGFQIGSKRLKVQHKRIHSGQTQANYGDMNAGFAESGELSTYPQDFAQQEMLGSGENLHAQEGAIEHSTAGIEQSVQQLQLEQ